MREIPTLTWSAFASRYCERQVQTPQGLALALRNVARHYHPDGFMLLECQVMDSSRLGSLAILPYGGQATFQTVPTHPISPRGLASDMSVVVALLPAGDVPTE